MSSRKYTLATYSRGINISYISLQTSDVDWFIQEISLSETKIIEAYSYISIPVVQLNMMSPKILLTLLLLMATVMESAQRVTTTGEAERKEIAKKTLAVDYSIPDYSIKKIDAKAMGTRLAKILESLCANYKQSQYLASLSAIQNSWLKA